jgi:hypothetical protein
MRVVRPWRRTLAPALVVAAAIASCAQPGAPPGGPPDAELPVLLKVLPDSNAVNVRTPAIVLQFDEVVSERSNAAGAPASPGGNTLGNVLLISPSDGRDEVIWRRTALELRPRRGLRPNTTYRVTLTPGLTDLRNNRTTEGFSYVFSTGATMATGTLRGVLFDWTTGRAAANARVEIFREADTTFRWIARSDSSGRFALENLEAGSYEVRGWVDTNNDRRISFREISDIARVALRDTASLELYAFLRDTMPPRIENVELVDSTGIRVRFDRGIVSDWDGVGATLFGTDSSVIVLGGPFVPSARFDSLARARRAASDTSKADTAGAAADTTKARRDTIEAAPSRPNVPAPGAEPPGRAVPDTGAAADRSDTVLPPPVFGRKVPETTWTAPLTSPLTPGTYKILLQRARGLNGRAVDMERELRVRPPAVPADTTKPPSDTTARTTPR